MRRFPPEFEDLLSREGRRVLARSSPLCGALADPRRRFIATAGLIVPQMAREAAALLNRRLYDSLSAIDQPIPPEAMWEMAENYSEMLPKTARVKTAYLDRRRARAYMAAEAAGLVAMLRSESFGAFAAALAGRELRPRWGIQVLCYGPGDYAGPHNDHHPEEAAAISGYLDMHITLSGRGVAQQWLVYARQGHFSEVVDVATAGGLTAYRLPFWHYTTPLVAKRGARETDARRWVLLGTFLYKRPFVADKARG
ncbi:MAG TPA: hypothetical protein VFZ07_08735 [Dongiaceae bacterium]